MDYCLRTRVCRVEGLLRCHNTVFLHLIMLPYCYMIIFCVTMILSY